MSPEKSLTPQIRFKGFTEAWEQRKLGDLLQYEQPQKYIVVSSEYDDSFDTPVLTAGQSFVLGWTNEKTGIKKANPENPVIIFDDFVTSSHYVDFPFKIKSSAMKLLSSTNSTIDIDFSFNLLKQINYIPISHMRHWISMFAQFNVYAPRTNEQIKIGQMFKKLDSLITLHQRKLDALKKIKSALLEKMFPKDGSNVPEIRFAGFTEAWEQRKAIDLFKDVSEKGFDNLPVLSATQDRGMVYRDENGINISHDKKNELTYKHVIPGQFVIHLRSFQGGFAHSAIEGITSPAYTVFKFSNASQHDDIFWKYIFMSERFIKSLETVTYGIRDGRSISYSEFLGLPFAVPEKEEESCIGYFLKKYDSLITLHQRKLDALKKIKSALLEKMFV